MKENEFIFSVNGIQYDIREIPFDKLRHLTGTGRAYTISGSGRDRKMGYRSGVMTHLGDIELSEWRRLIHQLIQRENEQQLFDDLKTWVLETCAWINNRIEAEEYALKLYSSRIFDNEEWVDYHAFNQRYRPNYAQAPVTHHSQAGE